MFSRSYPGLVVMSQFVSYVRTNRATVLLLSLLFFLIISLYSVTFAWLIDLWWTDRSSAHGFLVPLISLYLLWIKREQLGTLSPAPNYLAGSAITLAAAFLLVAGRAGAFMHAETVSLLLLLPGMVLLTLGWNYLKVLGFPLFYLQFMIPWSQPVLEYVHLPFQLLTAVMASFFLELLDFSTFRTGVFVQLPGFTMEVAPECSGITYLFSVIAIGLPLVYISQKSWRRGFLVLSAGIGTMFIANWFRVTIAGLMGIYYGVDQLHGPGHILRGWIVAQIGWVALFLANWRVGRITSASKYTLVSRWRSQSAPLPVNPGVQNWLSLPCLGATAFLMCLTVYLNFFTMPEPHQLKHPLKTFPGKIENWQSRNSNWIDGGKYFPGADEELTRTYRNPAGEEVYLYIAYFAVQLQDKALITFHNRPLHKNASQTTIGAGTDAPEIVNSSLIRLGARRYNVYFWYKLPGGEYTERLDTKLNVITDALLRRRNTGAVILVATRENKNGNRKEVRELTVFFQTASEKLAELSL